jgi:hypothetical protein
MPGGLGIAYSFGVLRLRLFNRHMGGGWLFDGSFRSTI